MQRCLMDALLLAMGFNLGLFLLRRFGPSEADKPPAPPHDGRPSRR